jgi:hypothetical protein
LKCGLPLMTNGENASTLEERKFALAAEIQRREMALKEAEGTRRGLSASQATIAGSALALISAVLGALIAAWSSQNIATGNSLTSLQIEELKAKGSLALEKSKQQATEALERKKFETSLILDAIKTPSRADAIRNLKFFVAAGFVTDDDGKIGKLNDDSLPSIGAPSQESAGRVLRATGAIVLRAGSSMVCTGVAISPRHIVTANFCIRGSPDAGAASVDFKTGRKTYPLRLVAQRETSRFALLELDSTAHLDGFLDRSRVRDPVLGERIYFALMQPDQQSVEVRTCSVVQASAEKSDFEYDCATGAGSAGAVIIGVKDDALLGVHHSGRVTGAGGVGAKIFANFGQFCFPNGGFWHSRGRSTTVANSRQRWHFCFGA